VKQGVHDYHVRIRTVNAGRQNQIKRQARGAGDRATPGVIAKKPEYELQQVWTWNGWNAMPNDAGGGRFPFVREPDSDIFDTLREEMYLAGIVAREALNRFAERALGAMPAIKERRNDRETQFNASLGQAGRRWASCSRFAR
jgi:hypothetical protein